VRRASDDGAVALDGGERAPILSGPWTTKGGDPV